MLRNKCLYLELKRCKVILYLSCKEELAATGEVCGMLNGWKIEIEDHTKTFRLRHLKLALSLYPCSYANTY
jgi:hypothetical protein